MNARQRYEIEHLASTGTLDLQNVADTFGVSLRSVRYDMNALNARLARSLEKDGFFEAVIVRSKTARLAEGVARTSVAALVSGTDEFGAEYLSSDERILAMVSMLCWSDGYVTVGDFADEFQVSRATVMRDLVKVYEFCAENGLEVERSRGKGTRVTSGESTRRSVLTRAARAYRKSNMPHDSFEVADYLNWFSPEDLTTIADIIRDAERTTGLSLDDTAFEAIVIHVALSIKRSQEGIRIEAPLDTSKIEESHAQSEMADLIIEGVDDAFGISLPGEERYYIEVHMGARSGKIASKLGAGGVGLEFSCIKLIADVSRALGRDLTHDRRLYSRILQHISGSVYRKRVGLLLENPMRDELMSTYGADAAVIEAALCEGKMDRSIPMTEDEVSYILLHFETAIVTNDPNEPSRPNVVVVCSTGFGTAELLAAEVERYFNVNIIANIPAHQAYALQSNMGIDLVISTVRLSVNLPCVEVRPILKEEDLKKISQALSEIGFTTKRAEKNVELDVPRSSAPGPQLVGSRLCDLICDNVVLDAQASTWQEAVRASGAPLVASGAITSGYVEATVEHIEKMGPYVVISKHVALPHSPNRSGVVRTAMSCVRLAQPVSFGSELNDPVHYEFMLACADATSHTQALVHLANLLQTRDFLDVLGTAQSPDDIVGYVSAYEDSIAGPSRP